MNKTQLVVIGAGPGGYAAAFYAADLGMQVTLIDKELNPGGVCLYRGCIPSKALLHVAKLLEETQHSSNWGIEFGKPKIDLNKLRDWKSGVVKGLTGGLGQLSRSRKINYVQGTATFQNPTMLRIVSVDGTEQDIEFEHAILATGSEPTALPFLPKDNPNVWNSTSALELPEIPENLLVIGGGYIGLELGTVYAALGTKVTVVEMTPTLLPGADRDLVNVLGKRLEKSMHSILLSTKVTEVKEQGKKLKVKFEGENLEVPEQVFDKVFVAIGRRPNSAGLGLENTKVKITQQGFVEANNQLRTAEPSIFAIGDLIGQPMLAHKASHEGRVAVEVISGKKSAFEPNAIPAVVFTDPEIAWAGLTEEDAKKQNQEVKIAKFPWGASGRAMTLDRSDGLTKLILEPNTERVLGVGIVGAGAGELISEGVLAIEMAATAKDVALTIHPHPTLSETVMESAEVFFGHSTHMYRPKK